MMSRKDYVKMADILGRARAYEHHVAVREVGVVIDAIEMRLVAWFGEENPRFDAQRFRKAARNPFADAVNREGPER